MTGWLLLVAGLALWVGLHMVKPLAPAARARLDARHGARPVKSAFALGLLLALGLIIWGYQAAPVVNVWFPPAWTVHLNNLLMVLAVLLMAGAAPRSPVRRFTRHPMLNGVKTWAVAHLLVNGDLASILLFGTMLGWGVWAMIALNRRDGKPPQDYEWTTPRILRTLAGTAVAFAAIAGVHAWLGVWPFPG